MIDAPALKLLILGIVGAWVVDYAKNGEKQTNYLTTALELSEALSCKAGLTSRDSRAVVRR